MVTGLIANVQKTGVMTAKATETKMGLMIVDVEMEADPDPSEDITLVITRPTMPSSMAALVSTTPRRVLCRPHEAKIVKVVPRLVEHNAAPATNACSGDAPVNDDKT